jgi:hypothetical protein
LLQLLNLPSSSPKGVKDKNGADNPDLVLIVGWLLGALCPEELPYNILGVAGQQGTAKTWLTRLLRGLIDPNISPIRSLPKNERDLANHGRQLLLSGL